MATYSENGRLCCLADTSRHVMQFFREERLRGLNHLAGNRYARNVKKKSYLNLISLWTGIIVRNMMSNNPRTMLSTFDLEQKPAVLASEDWINHEFERQDFAGTLKRITLDSLFSVAIAKCSLATPAESATMNYGLRAGSAFLSRIDLDDLVVDWRARDFNEVSFIGHRYRAPIDAVKDSKLFSKKARDRIKPMEQMEYNREGDQRVGTISREFTGSDELEDMVELWELYLPRQKKIKTFLEDDLSGPTSAWEGADPEPLREVDWVGPEWGPYIPLGHLWIPGQLFPKGPAIDLLDLHEHSNINMRKLVRESERFKKMSLCDSSNPTDAENINKANDGETVPVQNPKAVMEITQGGPDPGLQVWQRYLVDTFMEMGGNIRTLGGIATQAGTASQEEMLMQQSSGQIAAMQDNTVAFVSKCADSMLWYFWHDPSLVMKTKYKNPAVQNVDYVREVFPWNYPDKNRLRRTGIKPDLKIDPYSLRATTPQQRVKDIMAVITGVWAPNAQMAMQQGVVLNMNKLFSLIAKNMDLPELQEVLSMEAPPENVGNSQSSTSGPASTSREYVRKDVGRNSMQEAKMESDNAVAMMAANGQTNGQMMN